MLPDWTERDREEMGAVQHLKLNQFNDDLNQLLFPYVTVITAYARIVSWSAWIFARREALERSQTRHLDLRTRYYGILAGGDIAHSWDQRHLGPLGREGLEDFMRPFIERGEDVDFSGLVPQHYNNPMANYFGVIQKMGLVEIVKKDRTWRLSEPGHRLAKCFGEAIAQVALAPALFEQPRWKREDLERLGQAVCLHHIAPHGEEAALLAEGCRASLPRSAIFDDFIDLVRAVGEASGSRGFVAFDVSHAALFHTLPDGRPVLIQDNDATGLLAYQRLHYEFAYLSNVALASLSRVVEPGASIKFDDVVATVTDRLVALEPRMPKNIDDFDALLFEHYRRVNLSFTICLPPQEGVLHLVWIREQGAEAAEHGRTWEALAWAALGALVAVNTHSQFNFNWLEKWLPGAEESFYPGSLRDAALDSVEYRQWVEQFLRLLLEQHGQVAGGKGEHTRMVGFDGEVVTVKKKIDLSMGNGRLPNAVQWLADLKILDYRNGRYTLGGIA